LDELDLPYCEVEDVKAIHEDETMMHSLSFDEVIHILEAPAHEEVSIVISLSKILMMLYFVIWKVNK
jgi:hypothetical protein